RTLLALALLAERAVARSLPVRFLVLALLFRAEAIARRFVAREAAALIAKAAETGYSHLPDLAGLDLAGLDELPGPHRGPADAQLLSLRLRILAAVLGMLSDAEDIIDDGSAVFPDDWSCGRFGGWPAVAAPGADGTPLRPLLLVIRLPAARRPSRPP
ncbi:MAG TPA: hypothetical protein GX405_12565, partial [Rhizobiales bacterium]|nr:hypothetical protein [Hyphomicrobiales bacterium]